MRFSLGVLACAMCLLASACSGQDASVGTGSAPSVDVTGTWTAKWLSAGGGSGTGTLSITQSGGSFSGSVATLASPCFTGGALAGTVSGSDFEGSMTARGIQVNMSATVTGNTMNGTYDAVSAGACTGDTGTFSAAR